LTLTPLGPNSAASDRVIASVAPQAAEIPAIRGECEAASAAEIMTIEPVPGPVIRLAICLATSRAVRNCEPTIVRIGSRKVSTSWSSDLAG
jgi:hypothetical protein